MAEVRTGSHPDFCPPEEEGLVLDMCGEDGEVLHLEYLGMLYHNDGAFGFFYPLEDGNEVGGSGTIWALEATEFDEEGQPTNFSTIDDEAVLDDVYSAFKVATKDIYNFD